MKQALLAFAGLLVFACPFLVADDKKDDQKKMEEKAKLAIGEWEVTKGDSLKVGSTLVLTKDGKITFTMKDGATIETTYKYDGGKFMEVKIPDGETEKIEIKKLTDKEMEMYDSAKQTDVFKRKVKEKKAE